MALNDQQFRETTPVLRLKRTGDGSTPAVPEFFRRELGVTPHTVTSATSTDNSKYAPSIVAHCSTYPDELSDLNAAGHSNILLLIESDETFRLDLTRAILKHVEVRQVLRCYSIESSSWTDLPANLVLALQTAVRMGPGYIPMALEAWFAGAVVAGRKAISRALLSKAGVDVRSMPLGYTDAFVTGVESLGESFHWRRLGKEESVIDYLYEHQVAINSHKREKLAFVGQRGKFQRQAALRSAQRSGFSLGPIHEIFGGPGHDAGREATEYVSALARSRFSLCPPGNYSGESFRLGESLLLGALPVEVSRVISEPGWRPGRWTSGQTVAKRNLSDSLEEVRQMSEPERASRLQGATSAYIAAIRTARKSLDEW